MLNDIPLSSKVIVSIKKILKLHLIFIYIFKCNTNCKFIDNDSVGKFYKDIEKNLKKNRLNLENNCDLLSINEKTLVFLVNNENYKFVLKITVFHDMNTNKNKAVSEISHNNVIKTIKSLIVLQPISVYYTKKRIQKILSKLNMKMGVILSFWNI